MTPLKWIKTKDGGCKAEDYTVELVKDDVWRLVYHNKVMRTGTRDECKAQATETARLIAARPKGSGKYTDDPTNTGLLTGPPGTTVGAWKSENETGSEWLLRMAKEKGHHPKDLLANEHVVRDAKLDLENYPEDEVKQLVKEAFPLAQQWAKAYNASDRRLGQVEVSYNAWFQVSGEKVNEADRRFLEALDRKNKADVPEEVREKAEKVKVAREKPGPAGKDAWGFRLGTGAAEINTGLSTDWKTAEQIARDSKSQRAVHGHLKHLVTEGLAEMRGEGKAKEYRWVPLTKDAAKKAEAETAMRGVPGAAKKIVLKKKA